MAYSPTIFNQRKKTQNEYTKPFKCNVQNILLLLILLKAF